MTASNITFQLIVVVHIRISLPCLLMIFIDQNKMTRYTSDPLPDDITVPSGNSIITLDTHSNYPQVILLSSDAPSTDGIIMRDKPGRAADKIVYCSRHHGVIRCYRKYRYYFSSCYIHKIVYYYHGPTRFKS